VASKRKKRTTLGGFGPLKAAYFAKGRLPSEKRPANKRRGKKNEDAQELNIQKKAQEAKRSCAQELSDQYDGRKAITQVRKNSGRCGGYIR